MKSLSVVIVNWNTGELLLKCLKSVEKNIPSNTDVYVVDNASSDGSAQMVAKVFPWVKLVANKQNLGFAKANNQVLKKIKTEYALVLNPDTKVKEGAVEKLLEVLESEKDIAAAGPKLLNPDGSAQKLGFYRKFPSLLQTLFFYTDLYSLSIKFSFLVSRLWESNLKDQGICDVDQIPGAALMIKTPALKKVGFFDETYPIWFEDVDLCFKLKKLHLRLVYVPSSEIVHVAGGAFDKWDNRKMKETRFWRSLFTFFDKHKSLFERILVRTIIGKSLLFMVVSRLPMQLLGYSPDRQKFIYLKLGIFQRLFLEKDKKELASL